MLKIGFSCTEITPRKSMPMAGYAARKHPAQGAHDSLYARCCVISNEKALALVSLDLLSIPFQLYKGVVEEVKDLGIGEENIIIAATHTHAGPSVYRDEEYFNFLVSAVSRCVKEAIKNARKVDAVKSYVHEVPEIVVNRRDPEKGPVDPRLHAVLFKGPEVALINYACHAVVLGHNNLLYSADYPGALVKTFEKITGYKAVFFNGACGDINPFTPGTNLKKVYDRTCGTFRDVEWFGSMLAAEAAKSLLAEDEKPEFNFTSKTVKLKLIRGPKRPEVEERLKQAIKEAEEAEKNGDRIALSEARYEIFKCYRILGFYDTYGEVSELEVRLYAVKFSEKSAAVFIPGEVLVKLGCAIKESSPFPNTLVVTYCNHSLGYIVPREEYEKGGYEATYPITFLQPGEAEKIVETCTELLQNL